MGTLKPTDPSSNYIAKVAARTTAPESLDMLQQEQRVNAEDPGKNPGYWLRQFTVV